MSPKFENLDYQYKELTNSKKISAEALTPKPKGVSQEPNLAEFWNREYQYKVSA